MRFILLVFSLKKKKKRYIDIYVVVEKECIITVIRWSFIEIVLLKAVICNI